VGGGAVAGGEAFPRDDESGGVGTWGESLASVPGE